MEFAKRLRELRLNQKISCVALSELCGLSQSVIGKYERGELQPTMQSLIDLAEYFHCSIDFLVGRE